MEDEPLESIYQWNAHQVSSFIKGFLGLDRYTNIIRRNNINGRSLLYMSIASWQALGVDISGHRHALHSWATNKIAQIEALLPIEKHVADESNKNKSLALHQEEVKNVSISQPKLLSQPKMQVKMPKSAKEKSFLRENYNLEHRTFNKNMERIRRWAEKGLDMFPLEKFIFADLSKDKEMRQEIQNFIHKKRKTLSPFRCDGEDGVYMTERDIFLKLNQHRRYMKLKATSLFSHEGNQRGHPQLKKDIEDSQNINEDGSEKLGIETIDIENQTTSKETMFQAQDNEKPYDGCYVPAGIQELVAIIGSPKIISEENVQCRHGLLHQGEPHQFFFIPFLDEGTAQVGIGSVVSKSRGGRYERWKVEIESLDPEAHGLYIPGSCVQASSLHIGQLIEIPLVYLSMIENKTLSQEMLCKDTNLFSSSQRRSSIQSSPTEFYDALMEENTPQNGSTMHDLGYSRSEDKVSIPTNGSSTGIQSLVKVEDCETLPLYEPLDTSKKYEEIPIVNSSPSAEFCIDLNTTKERKKCSWKMLDLTQSAQECGVKIIKEFVTKGPLECDVESDEESFSETENDISIVNKKAKKAKVACLSTLKDKNNVKECKPTKKKALKDISNKQRGHENVFPSKRIARTNALCKRVIKIPAKYKDNIDNQASKSRKKKLSSSHQKLATLSQAKELKHSTKEAIALKLMGEDNIDMMYKRLDDFMKELRRSAPKEFVDIGEPSEKQETLDILMMWAFTNNKVKLKEGMGLEIGQDEVELL